MIQITTKRLYVFPLNLTQLETSILKFSELERELGLIDSGTKLSVRQTEVFKLRQSKVDEDPDNYIWNTVWPIVLIEENRIIGNIMLKGYPNENGEVIIGYSIDKNHRCNGYMTEALNGVISWILQNSYAKNVIADVLKDNIPSQRVLQKLGMIKYKEDDECFWWKFEVSFDSEIQPSHTCEVKISYI